MVKSLGKSIINMYSMGACSVLGITNQEALREDLENDPFLNLNVIKMGNVEWETIKMDETRKQPSKSEVIGSSIGMDMVGFCFGIGIMLAVKTVNNLECCINRKCL